MPPVSAQGSPGVETFCGLALSDATILIILEGTSLLGGTTRYKPLFSAIIYQKQLKFAQEYLQKPQGHWDNVLVTAECTFNVSGPDGRVPVWRNVQEVLLEKNL